MDFHRKDKEEEGEKLLCSVCGLPESLRRCKIIDKLRHHVKLDENYINLISFILKNNKIMFKQDQCHCLNFHGQNTEITQSRGVLQGYSLSHFLFITYIDDIVQAVEQSWGARVLFYAEDMIVLAEGRKTLQSAINTLAD